MKHPIITLLTDFGTTDYYVGAMKGVILGICPEAAIVDITHEVEPWQVAHGAWVLSQTWRCYPEGTIHVAIVDPGVGSERHPIVAEAAGHYFIGPDNGVFGRVFAEAPPAAVRRLTTEAFFRQPVSRTFHGRDIFAPVAAHLAKGVESAAFGPLVRDFMPHVSDDPLPVAQNQWQGKVLWVDRFGNLVTNFSTECFGWVAEAEFQMETGCKKIPKYCAYYSAMEPGYPYLTAGSAGYLEVSINQRHAGNFLGVKPGDPVSLRRL